MSSSAVRCVHEVFERFEAKDGEGVVELFAVDGLFVDPHYPPPIGPSMAGHQAIRQGILWALGIVEQPHFRVRYELAAGDSDAVAAFEVETNHTLVGGGAIVVTQVFIAEVDDAGRLRRLQSYTPYPPPVAE